MLTDRPPLKDPLHREYLLSDRNHGLVLPTDDRLQLAARDIHTALESGRPATVRLACAEFLNSAANFYEIPAPPLRLLAARPIRLYESGSTSELFGDYDIESTLIRVWMRTAIKKRVTSYGTFLATLCHEFCHHLDFVKLGFHDSPHTRGFYERAAVLYHHARETPPKKLYWVPVPGGRFRIDWQRTNQPSQAASPESRSLT